MNGAVGRAQKVADAKRVALVAHVRGRHRQARRGVRGDLGLDVVDDEGDFHWELRGSSALWNAKIRMAVDRHYSSWLPPPK
jgi:hypothetical protein